MFGNENRLDCKIAFDNIADEYLPCRAPTLGFPFASLNREIKDKDSQCGVGTFFFEGDETKAWVRERGGGQRGEREERMVATEKSGGYAFVQENDFIVPIAKSRPPFP